MQIFDARLAALADAADQSTRIIDVRLADMVEAANRNTETIDERLIARIQVMSEVLTRAASEAESIWSARGAAVANAIRAKVDDLREVIEGKGADLVTALGERGDEVSARFVGVGERAMHTLDQQMAGLATLLTRRTDELIAAVNGSAADPVRALSALTGQLRSEVDRFQRSATQRRRRRHPPVGRDDRSVAQAIDRAGGSVQRFAQRNRNPQR